MTRYIFFFTLFCVLNISSHRSPFRKEDPAKPKIITRNQKNSVVQFENVDWFYYKNSIFTTFCEDDFFANIVQKDSIINCFGNEISLPYELLNNMLEVLISEVKQEKNTYTHFTLLKNKNFNRKKKCGLIILKFNDYPFVVKLFMEHPSTLLNPLCKGFENRLFHYMGQGINRHLAGPTRVYNLKRIQSMLKDLEYNVILPRKWFWLPQNPEWIEVEGYNIIPNTVISTMIPGIYVIIADELNPNPEYQSLSPLEHNEIVMKFCNDLHLIVDPHSDNFIVQKNNNGEIFISILDTEHFPTLVGISETATFSDHIQWYFSLAWKALNDLFMTSKQDHLILIKK